MYLFSGPHHQACGPIASPMDQRVLPADKAVTFLPVSNLIHWQLLRARYSYSESLSAPLHPVRASSQQTHSHWIPRFTKDPLFPKDSPMLQYITGMLGQMAAQKLVLKSNKHSEMYLQFTGYQTSRSTHWFSLMSHLDCDEVMKVKISFNTENRKPLLIQLY